MFSGEHICFLSSKAPRNFGFRCIKMDLWPLLLLLLSPCKSPGLFAGHKVVYPQNKLHANYL